MRTSYLLPISTNPGGTTPARSSKNPRTLAMGPKSPLPKSASKSCGKRRSTMCSNQRPCHLHYWRWGLTSGRLSLILHLPVVLRNCLLTINCHSHPPFFRDRGQSCCGQHVQQRVELLLAPDLELPLETGAASDGRIRKCDIAKTTALLYVFMLIAFVARSRKTRRFDLNPKSGGSYIQKRTFGMKFVRSVGVRDGVVG